MREWEGGGGREGEGLLVRKNEYDDLKNTDAHCSIYSKLYVRRVHTLYTITYM